MLSEADLNKRIGKITSSTAAACLGLDERITPIGAWLLIRGEQATIEKPRKRQHRKTIITRAQQQAMLETNSKLDEDDGMRKACERGNILENLTLEYPCEELGRRHGQPVVRTPAPFRRHPKYDWTGDSCDALYFLDDGPVSPNDPWSDIIAIGEGKTAALGVAVEYGDDFTDEMPQHTLCQSHFHLVHWPEADLCVVPVLVGGWAFEFKLLEVQRDEEFEGIMMDDLAKFHHDYIVGDKMPPAEAGDGKYLRAGFGKRDVKAAPDSDEIKEWAIHKALASKAEKDAKKRVDTAKCRLIQLLGNAEVCDADWGKVTYYHPQDTYKTDWEYVAYELFDWFGVPGDERNALIGRSSDWKENSRTLRVTLKKHIKKELGL